MAIGEPNAVDKYVRINPATGFYEPDWMYRSIMPFWLGFDEQFTAGALTVPVAGSVTSMFRNRHSSPGPFDGDLGNPMLLNRIMFENSGTDRTASADFTIMLKDIGDQAQYMNQPIHIQAFAGTAQLSGGFGEPLFFPSRHILQATYANVASASTASIRHFFGAKQFYTWSPELNKNQNDKKRMIELVNYWLERRKYVIPFWLTHDTTVTLNAQLNSVQEVDANLGDDGHFEGTHLVCQSTGNFALDIIDPKTKQSYTNGQITKTNGIGNAQNPMELDVPMLLKAGSRLRLRFTNLTSSTNRCFFAIRGRRVRAPMMSWKEISTKFPTLKGN